MPALLRQEKLYNSNQEDNSVQVHEGKLVSTGEIICYTNAKGVKDELQKIKFWSKKHYYIKPHNDAYQLFSFTEKKSN